MFWNIVKQNTGLTIIGFYFILYLGCTVSKKAPQRVISKEDIGRYPYCTITGGVIRYINSTKLQSIREPGTACGTCPPRVEIFITPRGDSLIRVIPEVTLYYTKVSCVNVLFSSEGYCGAIKKHIYCPPPSRIFPPKTSIP